MYRLNPGCAPEAVRIEKRGLRATDHDGGPQDDAGQKEPRRFGRPGRVYRSSPRRELRGGSAPKDKGPARGRPLLCLSGCSGASGGLSAAARIAAIGRAQAPPNPPAGGPQRTTCGPLLWRQACASVLICVSPIAWAVGGGQVTPVVESSAPVRKDNCRAGEGRPDAQAQHGGACKNELFHGENSCYYGGEGGWLHRQLG